MTQPTHTHRESGGKYAELQQHEGAGPLAGQWLVIYEDLDKGIQSATTQDDWLANWREIAPDDCTVCMGTGTDHIKGNAKMPCGHCYGLGKVMDNGDRPTEMWDVAGIATLIIERQQTELHQLRQVANNPAVQALIEQQHQQAMSDSVAHQERQWRDGKGHGPGGQRYTGD
ncbi:hypothetical protein [Vreelandella venusta]|uniref:hypothetical protein n=1 Tax=Vreelandella venusta TaxID=44935 RepID=UPI00200D20BC|nr:hypothetical protein [Halomonas venusta]UQI41885.1 hypothetical protein M3L73_06405 [Halomonas venusta]